jgi:ribosomal protein S27AE
MCESCIEIDRTIGRYRRFLKSPLDPLTMARVTEALYEMAERKESLHREPRPRCPNCEMNMIVVGELTERSLECLRCGYIAPAL